MIERYYHVRAEAKRKPVSVFNQVSVQTDSPQNPPQSVASGINCERNPKCDVSFLESWWAVRDSNPRHPACKAGALTN